MWNNRSEEELKELAKPTLDIPHLIEQAVIKMVLDYPVLAHLLSRVGLQTVDDFNQPYWAWTDGSSVTLNRTAMQIGHNIGKETGKDGKEYNLTVSKEKILFTLAHELGHLINLTNDRGNQMGILWDDVSPQGKMKHELWNKATDYEINSALHHNKNGSGSDRDSPIGDMPDWVCYDKKYVGWTAEKIYKDLLNDPKVQQQMQQSFSVSFTQGDGEGKGKGQSGDNKDEPDNGLSIGLDKHKPITDEMTKNELVAKIAEALDKGKEAGTGMSAFNRMCEELFKPEPFNWRRALSKYIRSFIKDNYTWNRPSRAGIANGIILPSVYTTPTIKLAVAIDTSGSVGEKELSKLMNHLYTILTQFKKFEIDVWCFSTKVHPKTFKTFKQGNRHELKDFTFESDGGTDISSNLPFIEQTYKGKKPDAVLILTDGFDNLSGDTKTATSYPVVWMIVDNDNFVKPSLMPGEVYSFKAE